MTKRKNYLYKEKEVDRIPYNRYDIVCIIPKGITGRIKFLLNPINFLYLYVGDWHFARWNFDEEIREFGYNTDGLVDVRHDKFSNCFIDIWRNSGRLNTVDSPEKELVMFNWRKEYLKPADLRFYGKAI